MNKINNLLAIVLISSLCLFGVGAYVFTPLSPSAVPVAPPTEATGALVSGKALTPWSGWWWPFHEQMPPNLYQPEEAMARYDSLSLARGQPDPQALAWERERHYTDKPGEEWFGHCNGWAAASILEPEPRKTNTVQGIEFRVRDQKGLLAEWHWWDPATAFYGTRYNDSSDNINDIEPQEFHRILIDFIGENGRPLIFDTNGGTKEKDNPMVWNFPAYEYKMEYRPDSNHSGRTHVRCQVWFASFTQPDRLGTANFIRTYYYWLEGDIRRPAAGEWEKSTDGGWDTAGDSLADHPDFAWYPAKATSHQVLTWPQVSEILQGGNTR